MPEEISTAANGLVQVLKNTDPYGWELKDKPAVVSKEQPQSNPGSSQVSQTKHGT